MIYDLIIIGAGAAGLFAAANVPDGFNTLVLERTDSPGKKLLLTGSGQCNLTNNEPIKAFLNRYGENGKKLRPVLFPFSNMALMEYFEEHGLPLLTREDGKVFPASMRSADVLSFLLQRCEDKNVEIRYNANVTKIECSGEVEDYKYCVHTASGSARQGDGSSVLTTQDRGTVPMSCPLSCNKAVIADPDPQSPRCNADSESSDKRFFARRILIATGGESYPQTGSNGSMFECLEHLGLELVPRRPALTSIYVEGYPYSELSGLTFANSSIKLETSLFPKDRASQSSSNVDGSTVETSSCDAVEGSKVFCYNGSLLFTHKGLSGPPVLALSRYARQGDRIIINYLPGRATDELRLELIKSASGDLRQTITLLESHTALPRSFLENICHTSGVDRSEKASRLTGKEMGVIASRLAADSHVVRGTGDFSTAMTTAGGVDLDEIDLKTMEAKRFPGLYFAGEVLDVDGDTGGYNLQFAFSSAMRCIDTL